MSNSAEHYCPPSALHAPNRTRSTHPTGTRSRTCSTGGGGHHSSSSNSKWRPVPLTFARSHSQPTANKHATSSSSSSSLHQQTSLPLNAAAAAAAPTDDDATDLNSTVTRTQSVGRSTQRHRHPTRPLERASSALQFFSPLSGSSRLRLSSSSLLRPRSTGKPPPPKHQPYSAPLHSASECRPNALDATATSSSSPSPSTFSLSTYFSFYDGFGGPSTAARTNGNPSHPNMATTASDAKYKSYVTAIDKALKSFEYTSEWADLVSALSKLQRVLTNNSKFKHIPRRFIVGQRLAQCMHPLLPSGVHLKALEVYDEVFKILGEERLLAELTIYSNGLFPLLTNAAINVRPSILDLYERRLLPLSDRIKPALDGFLIGVLPCYEEGSDTFQRTDRLLLQVGSGVGLPYFYDSLWRCILYNSSVRLSAITFIIGHFNKKRPLGEQAQILGLCMQTVVRAICASLLDSKILVQRAILDLLITCFPLHLNLSNEMEQAMASPAAPTVNGGHSAFNQTSTGAGLGTTSGPSSLNLATGKTDAVQQQAGAQAAAAKTTEPNASPVAATKTQPPNYLPLQAAGQTSSKCSSNSSSIPRHHFKRSELVAIITAALTVLLRRDVTLSRRLLNWFFGSDSSGGGGGGSAPPERKTASKSNLGAGQSSSNLAGVGSGATDAQNSKSSSSSSSSAGTRKSKRIVYFENYAKSLVLEAFKRCITNPVSAITSILPATAITNSFITFTIPLTSTTADPHSRHPPGHPLHQSALAAAAASAGSSPPGSTTSLFGSPAGGLNRSNSTSHHHQRTRTVIASSLSQSYNSGSESYSTTNSTFWPYRLLICILDQRDIANPILDVLCVDILRGLFHEFELLTTVIPPPSTVIPESAPAGQPPSSPFGDELYGGYPISSSTTATESEASTSASESESEESEDGVESSTSSLSTSIAAAVGSSSALMSSSDDSHDEAESEDRRRPKSSVSAVKSSVRSQESGAPRPNTGGTTRNPPTASIHSHSRKLSGSSSSSKRMGISASAPTVASVDVQHPEGGKVTQKSPEEKQLAGDSTLAANESHNSSGLIREGAQETSILSGHSATEATNASLEAAGASSSDIEGDFSGEDSKKHHMNMFTNFSKKVKTKSATMIRNLQRPFDGGNSNRSSTEIPASVSVRSGDKVKNALKTLPLVKQLKNQLDKNRSKRKSAKKRLTASVAPNLLASIQANGGSASGATTNDGAQSTAPPVPSITIFEDENCFQLPHQHYYWNQYYQQLDKFQRRELLKELDRVMHLLITNVGVDFIWSKLAHIFQSATEEAVSLKKLLRLIVKDVERCEVAFGSEGSEDDSLMYGVNGGAQDEDDSIGNVSEDSSDSEDPDYEPDLETDDQDTLSCSSSLSWARSLASSLLTEFIHDYQRAKGSKHPSHQQHQQQQQHRRYSVNHSSSSSPVPFADLLQKERRSASLNVALTQGRSRSSTNATASLPTGKSQSLWLKNKLLCGLTDRCRSCHAVLSYLSPVQPVGTDSLTVLEACTLVRFLLGDSRPYYQANARTNTGEDDAFSAASGLTGGSSAFFSSSPLNIANSLMTNSVTASMNRCSALEPLAVETSNYHFLIQFLDHSLKLMSGNVKSFSPVDLRASVELCLALCAKLKPAIMQTFVLRYRHSLGEHLRANLGQSEGAEGSTANASNHRRKSSIGSFFSSGGGGAPSGPRKTRSSSTASSKKQLELVKEEDEDREEVSPVQPSTPKDVPEDDPLADDVDGQMRLTEVNDDLKMELVVDGILNFFVVFVESILVRSDRSDGARKCRQTPSVPSVDLPPNALRLLQFYRDSLCPYPDDPFVSSLGTFFEQTSPSVSNQPQHADTLNVRHQMLPIYEQLCELLVEVGTVPLLTSPAFLLKRRHLPTSPSKLGPFSSTQAQLASLLSNFAATTTSGSKEVDPKATGTNSQLSQLSNCNVRWFIYLLVLSANRLSSCSHMHTPRRGGFEQHHHQQQQPNSALSSSTFNCCALRHIAYTSLGTVLDLLTISRAYLGSQQSAASASATASAATGLSHATESAEGGALLTSGSTSAFHEQLFSGTPSFSDMSLVDMFPGSLTARRLNFFPLIHPDLLDHLNRETVWFKMIAVRLWSNLAAYDSPLHYGTIAMLQQLHSISADSSICEAVLCDEMTGGEHYRGLIEERWSPVEPQLPTVGYYGGLAGRLASDKLYSARSRFQLLFETIREIRFISERLALIVTGLASAAKIDPELESDDHSSDQYDPMSGSTLTAISGVSTLITGTTGASAEGASGSNGSKTASSSLATLRTMNQKLFLTDGLDSFSGEIIANLDPSNYAELDRILRLTCPVSPVALCTTLKRHFDRPLFIMLDALAQRRSLSEHASSAADWLLRCLSPFDPFGSRNLPLPTAPLLASYHLGASGGSSEQSSATDTSQDAFLFGGFGANTDIGRLLEPLLFILLHPNTSRLSVQNSKIRRFTRHLTGSKSNQHISMTPNSSFDQLMEQMADGLASGESTAEAASESAGVNEACDVDESKIYAISSTMGNVIYHVRAKPAHKSSPLANTSPQLSLIQREMSPTATGRRSLSPNVTLMTNFGSGGRSPGSASNFNSTRVFSELVEISRLGDLPASVEGSMNRRSFNTVGDSMKLVVNPFDNLSYKTLPGHVQEDVFSFSSPHSGGATNTVSSGASAVGESENIILTVVKQVVSELVSSVEEKTTTTQEKSTPPAVETKPKAQEPLSASTPTAAAASSSRFPSFPGMASAAHGSPTSSSGADFAAAASSTTQIHISHLHLHLLLYERQYDSAQTLYALDTILNMIETWPNRMLYSMATSTFGESSSPTAPGGHLDGTRSTAIQSLYAKHRNSIQGRGFQYTPPPLQESTTTNSHGRSTSFKSTSQTHKRTASTDERGTGVGAAPSILHNISLLELLVQNCLQYLRSYYPSCPSGTTSTPVKSTKSQPGGLYQLFHSLKQANQSTCIDLESIYGNQRVRLMACEILRIIFHHLSSMMDQSNSSLFGSTSSSSGRFFSSGSRSKGADSLPNWMAHLRPFAQYLHDMLLRCEVQRNVLQCLVTSVWHYQQKKQSNGGSSKTATAETEKPTRSRPSSFLYPPSQQVDPAANAFINEILEFNDYPARIVQKSLDSASGGTVEYSPDDTPSEENDAGFHDEFEKCLLRLLEQVMILESRVATTSGWGQSASSLSGAHNDSLSGVSSAFKSPRYHMDLTELRFDPNVCLAGQPLLHGAIQLALQQSARRHIHATWLAFVESSLPFAGRFLSRLVLCVLHQLCRNLDSSIDEIERFSSCAGNRHLESPFTSKHTVMTLQSITMLLSYCLLDRCQLEPLLPFLNELFEDDDEEMLKNFGLSVQSGRRRKRAGRSDAEPSGVDLPTSGSGVSTGPIQILSSLFHNLMVVPTIASTSANGSTSASGSGASQDTLSESSSGSDSPAILEARKSILTMLNRVIVSLFNVWCTMVVVGEDPEETADGSTIEESMKNLGSCSHYYMQFPRHSANLLGSSGQAFASEEEYLVAMAAKRNRFKHSSCSSGWASTPYTGWFIMGTATQVKKAIMILLSIVSASHGPSLMASLAQVWSDLRDNPGRSVVSGGTDPGPSFNYLNGAIDLVIAPVSSQQRQLIQLIRSLCPLFSLETLITTIRTTMKTLSTAPSSAASQTSTSSSTSRSRVTSPPPFYLLEVALLEFFLAYIRSFPGHTLLKSWRCIMALVKETHALNVQASIPLSAFQAVGTGNCEVSNSTATINIQALINFHLLAILHEFLFYAPLCEDRRAAREMQEVATKLIESIIAVAGSRLSHSRWTLRRNLEVLPVTLTINPTEQQPMAPPPVPPTRGSPPIATSNRHSTGYRTDVESCTETDTESYGLKRGLFRSSASVSFQERAQQLRNASTHPDTTIDQFQMSTSSSHNLEQSACNTSTYFNPATSSDHLFVGLFAIGLPTASTSGGPQDVASLSQMMFDNFFCVKALYALSEFAAPVLDVVYPSDEKEKMIPLIVSLMSYVVPYLRAHMPHNWPCFDACSRLLASLTDYQYTRKAWRRETLDLLLDCAFFQMPGECLPAWRTIVDRVMTHDKNTFREFLGRMSVAQSPSSALKIFVTSSTVRDQEAELKGQLVKRLAFILFCSEKDQYQRYMSEIQEKLIEIHRTSNSPLVQAQVLLAFRVIILRMSPHHLASLWPFIYTEMFQVFLNTENTLLEYIRKNDQRFATAKEPEPKSSVTSALSEILNTFNSSSSASAAPTPTQPDSLLSFAETCSSASNLDSLSTGGSRCGTLKFKPVMPSAASGASKKAAAQLTATLTAQAAAQRFEPLIPPASLQLFLNACKLLDLALILPSDTLPIFQMHRWSFVSDAISFHNSNSSGAAFDLTTLFSASASSAAIADINATPVSGRHQMDLAFDQMDNAAFSQMMHASHSATNLDTASESTVTFDSLSLNSTISGHDSIASSQPSSLQPLSSMTSTTTSGRTYPNFIPHIVFLNSILNYLSNNAVKPVSYSSASPILTISSIDSVHDLHGFFQALLARSSRSPSTAMVTPSGPTPAHHPPVLEQTIAEQLSSSKQTTPVLFKRNPRRASKGLRASGKLAAKRGSKANTETSGTNGAPPSASFSLPQAQPSINSSEQSSLDELFINIDRIIASDFLESLTGEGVSN